MAYQGISTGIVANDGTGDSLLTGAVKINSNFLEIYNELGNGSSLNLTGKVQGIVNSSSSSYAPLSGVSTSVIGGIGSLSQLAVSGISTLGSVQISSGIVTSTSGIVTYYGDGSKLQGVVPLVARTTVSTTTASIGAGSTASLSLTGYKTYGLLKVGISGAGWLRIYTDSDSRTADIPRTQGIDPAPDAGVIAEVISTGSTTVLMSPGVIGWNNDVTPTSTIYASVTNNELVNTAFTISLTIIKLED